MFTNDFHNHSTVFQTFSLQLTASRQHLKKFIYTINGYRHATQTVAKSSRDIKLAKNNILNHK